MRTVSIITIFVFKQKTAYEMRISDWSSDLCSSDLRQLVVADAGVVAPLGRDLRRAGLGVPQLELGEIPAIGIGHGGGEVVASEDRKSVVLGKSGSVRVDLGGRRIITQKKK